jgi:heme exporter protein D
MENRMNSVWNNIGSTLSTFNYTTAVGSALGVRFAEMAKQFTNQAQQRKDISPEQAQQLAQQGQMYAAQANKMQEIAAQFQIGGIETQNRIAQATLKLLG